MDHPQPEHGSWGPLRILRAPWHRWRSAPPLELTLIMPAEPAQGLNLTAGPYRIGRESSLELPIQHPAVSRRHARLERQGGHWLLTDTGSSNGLWLGERRIKALLLAEGDAIRLAPTERGEAPTLLVSRCPATPMQRGLRVGSALLASVAATGLALLLVSLAQGPIRGSLSSVRGPLVLRDQQNRPLNASQTRGHQEHDGLRHYPGVLIDALLASEDSRFWWHPGVDPIGTLRALLTNLLGGRVLEGGSTLTQQLARNLYPEQVGQGETLERKWRELLVALQLEMRFSKRDLLLAYLNRVYLGGGWGFEDGARAYFNKPARDLTLEEAALLVGLLPSPHGHDPCLHPEAALSARNAVLRKMEDGGRLSPEQARQVSRRPLLLGARACQRLAASADNSFYADQVRRDLERLVGPEVAAEGNFLLDTHYDPALQRTVDHQLRQTLLRLAPLGITEGAVVVLDGRTGGISAIAGGRDYRRSQFNRASMAMRQPGSAFKLFPYLVALERGARPSDPIDCSSLDWGGQSFSSSCGGSLSLRQALAMSSNTAALRLARRHGLQSVVAEARRLGLTTPLRPVPGLVLGQDEVRLVELTAAYGAVANGGIWHTPTTIRRLRDGELCAPAGDNTCTSYGAPPARRVLKASVARQMQGLLEGVVQAGTGNAAGVWRGIGGKTGTTNGGRDLLFVGFDPRSHRVAGVWLGNDDNRPTQGSGALAAALWGDIIQAAGPAPPPAP